MSSIHYTIIYSSSTCSQVLLFFVSTDVALFFILYLLEEHLHTICIQILELIKMQMLVSVNPLWGLRCCDPSKLQVMLKLPLWSSPVLPLTVILHTILKTIFLSQRSDLFTLLLQTWLCMEIKSTLVCVVFREGPKGIGLSCLSFPNHHLHFW